MSTLQHAWQRARRRRALITLLLGLPWALAATVLALRLAGFDLADQRIGDRAGSADLEHTGKIAFAEDGYPDAVSRPQGIYIPDRHRAFGAIRRRGPRRHTENNGDHEIETH